MIIEIDNLADIADLAGSLITDRQYVDISYIVLQCCKPFKMALRELNKRPVTQRNWKTFKTHFCDAHISLRKMSKITVEEGLNHTKMVDMVLEGVREALAEHTLPDKQINNASETEFLYQQVQEMQELLKKMNNAKQQCQ